MAFDFTAALNVQTNPANLNKVNKDIQKSLNKVSLNLDAKNIAKAQGEIKKLQGTLNNAKSVAVQFGEAVSLKAVNFAAYTLASTAVLKLTGAVSNATRESLKLQEELAKIAQVTNKSNKEIFAQSNLLKRISVEYNIASSKVAQLTRTLAQTGLSFQQAAKAAEVLARTSLLATFDSLQSTTEGFIATLSSFSLTVDQAAVSLEAINAVSKRFAVESSDIVEAVRRTGGAFSAAGGNINELIALFTAVRSTSRESAETIATGFRTIFGRLQRPKTIEFFKELGIQLETAEGQFVGPLQAIQNISQGLDRLNISVGSTKFAEVVEQIGGIRQLSRVVPLLTQSSKITTALGVANSGTAESAEDLIKAQQTIGFQLQQLQKNFAAFIDDIVSSPTFQLLAKSIISIANALVEVGRALTPLIPLFTVLATVKLSKGLGSLIGGKGGGGKGLLGFNAGGFVPGSGNSDTVPAMLTPGEFVIRKSAAQAFGAENLQAINKYKNGDTVKGPQNGDTVKGPQTVVSKRPQGYGMIVAKEGNPKDRVGKFTKDGVTYQTPVRVSGFTRTKLFEKQKNNIMSAMDQADSSLAKAFDAKTLTGSKQAKDKLAPALGQLFENVVITAGKADNPGNANFDLPFVKQPLKELTDQKAFGLTDIKLSDRQENVNDIARKALLKNGPKKFATGGMASGTDTVPALLTPGEFVVNKKSAQAFGYGNLKEVNKYAKGGVVQKFQFGGVVGGLGGGGGGFAEFAQLAGTFTTISVASQAYQGVLIEGTNAFKGAFSNTVTSIKETIAEREKLNAQIVDAQKALDISTEAYADAGFELGKASAKLQEIRDIGELKAFDSSTVDTDIDTLSTRNLGPELEGADLAKAQSELEDRYKRVADEYNNDAEVTKSLSKIKKDLSKSTGKQNVALDKLEDRLKNSTKQYEVSVQKQKENLDAVEAETEARAQVVRDLKSQKSKGGFFGKIKGAVGGAKATEALQGLAQAGDLLANVIIAKQVSALNQAADAANKLKDEAIAAGDAEAAKTQAIEASRKKAEAEAKVQSSAIFSGIGAGIGTLFGPLGTVIGGVIGKFIGMSSVATEFIKKVGKAVGIDFDAQEREAVEQAVADATTNRIKAEARAAKESIALQKQFGNTDAALSILSESSAKAAASFLDRGTFDEGKRKSANLQLADFGGDELEAVFQKLIKQNPGASIDELINGNLELSDTFDRLQTVANAGNEGLKTEFEGLKSKLEITAATLGPVTARLDEYARAQTSLNVALGKGADVFAILGDKIDDAERKELQRRQAIFDSYAQVEKKRVSLALESVSIGEDIAKRQASLLGGRGEPTSRDIQRSTRRKVATTVSSDVGTGTRGLNTLFDRLKFIKTQQTAGQREGESNEAFQGRLAGLNTEAAKYQQAIQVLTKGTQEQTKAAIAEAKGRAEAQAALDDFKGGLIEEFAFGTDEQRRDLGRSAAVTAQAVQQGGLQNIASEDRGAVKAFLDRLPQDVALDTLGGKTAGRVKAEFAADEAVRSGIISEQERDEFVKKAEQKGKPIEERVGTAYESAVKAGLAAEQNFLQQKNAREQELLNQFGTNVTLFGQKVSDLTKPFPPGQKKGQGPTKEQIAAAKTARQEEIKAAKAALEEARIGKKGERGAVVSGGRVTSLDEEKAKLAELQRAAQLIQDIGKGKGEARSISFDQLQQQQQIAKKTGDKGLGDAAAQAFALQNAGQVELQIESQRKFIEGLENAEARLKDAQTKPLQEFLQKGGGQQAGGQQAGGQQAGGQQAGGQVPVNGELNVTNNIPQLDGLAGAIAGLGKESGPLVEVMAAFLNAAANANSPDEMKAAAANAGERLANPTPDQSNQSATS